MPPTTVASIDNWPTFPLITLLIGIFISSLIAFLSYFYIIATKRAEDIALMNKELESFNYAVSHDLQTPLRHIISFAQLLNKDNKDFNVKNIKQINAILDSAKNMNILIEDFLNFSHSKKIELLKRSFCLRTVINDALSSFNQEINNKNIIIKISENSHKINADYTMLKMVFINLISNAIKFTKNDLQTIIEIGIINGDNNKITVYIKDNGIGFDMKYVNKIFEPFQRLHNKKDFYGTGIGLATVKQIIEKHKGMLWATSIEGEGSTFYFTLPTY